MCSFCFWIARGAIAPDGTGDMRLAERYDGFGLPIGEYVILKAPRFWPIDLLLETCITPGFTLNHPVLWTHIIALSTM